MKESFQKMLENKTEHIKNACQLVTGMDLGVRIKVSADSGSPAPQKKTAAANRSSSSSREASPKAETLESQTQSPHEQKLQGDSNADFRQEESPQQSNSSESQESSDGSTPHEFDATMVKEAYKLFEGPGSRRLS